MNSLSESPGIYHPTSGGGYVECLRNYILSDERKTLDLIACCGEHESHRLLIHAQSLPDDFFDLRTGLAGQILLKFSTYKIILATVIPPVKIGHGKFYEMVLETNRGREFRVFSTELEAIQWLVGN